MATTLSDVRFTVEHNIQDSLDNQFVINSCNVAQSEFMLRVKISKSTTLAVNTTALSYNTLPVDILEFRRFRFQSDLDNKSNRPISPVFSFYNDIFEVPVPFPKADTLLIDYYSYLKSFAEMTDTIDLVDRFKPLYTTYIESAYYNLPSTRQKVGEKQSQQLYTQLYGYYLEIKKQVMDYYIVAIGVEKPGESGW